MMQKETDKNMDCPFCKGKNQLLLRQLTINEWTDASMQMKQVRKTMVYCHNVHYFREELYGWNLNPKEVIQLLLNIKTQEYNELMRSQLNISNQSTVNNYNTNKILNKLDSVEKEKKQLEETLKFDNF